MECCLVWWLHCCILLRSFFSLSIYIYIYSEASGFIICISVAAVSARENKHATPKTIVCLLTYRLARFMWRIVNYNVRPIIMSLSRSTSHSFIFFSFFFLSKQSLLAICHLIKVQTTLGPYVIAYSRYDPLNKGIRWMSRHHNHSLVSPLHALPPNANMYQARRQTRHTCCALWMKINFTPFFFFFFFSISFNCSTIRQLLYFLLYFFFFFSFFHTFYLLFYFFISYFLPFIRIFLTFYLLF